jgi:ribosomal protein S13
MAIRIVGVDLPQNKRGEVALTYIYGIGRSAANTILTKAEVDRDIKVKDWTDDQAARIREIISTEFKVEKLLLSAISNWEQKNDRKAETGELFIKTISVDEGTTLKRLRTAPQGRGHRIRKRSNHVTIVVDRINKEEQEQN